MVEEAGGSDIYYIYILYVPTSSIKILKWLLTKMKKVEEVLLLRLLWNNWNYDEINSQSWENQPIILLLVYNFLTVINICIYMYNFL